MKHNQYNLSPCIAFECHGTYFNNLSKAVATAIREDDMLRAAFVKHYAQKPDKELDAALEHFARQCLRDSTPNFTTEVGEDGFELEYGTYSYDAALRVASIRLLGIPRLREELDVYLYGKVSTALTATVARGVISLRLDIAGRDSTCRTNFPRIRELLRAYGFGDIWLVDGRRRSIGTLRGREGYSFSAKRTVKL